MHAILKSKARELTFTFVFVGYFAIAANRKSGAQKSNLKILQFLSLKLLQSTY